ncbi:MAG: hypothetical protein J6W93_08120 [Clostridia bacterium]|nr:hypothetical protein [Clostridia bacterium]
MFKNVKNKKAFVTALVFVLVIALAAAAGMVTAKYFGEKDVKGSVGLKADLAESITVYEHVANRQTDGSYKLDSSAVTEEGQTYMLMPGVDIYKDPTVRVTGYTGVPAYLFVVTEVSEYGTALGFNLASGWQSLSGHPGVWYKELTSADIPGEDETYKDYPVLETLADGYQIDVFENLPRESEYTFAFKAYIGQKTVDYNTPAKVFDALTSGD